MPLLAYIVLFVPRYTVQRLVAYTMMLTHCPGFDAPLKVQ